MKYFTLLLVALLAGCSAQSVPPKSVTPKEPVPITPELLEFAKQRNRFAFELYDRVRGTKGNLVVSPYSISTAMGMVYAGAAAETAKEIRDVLHFPDDLVLAMKLNADLRNCIAYCDEGEPPFVETNHLWPANDFNSHASYRSVITETFNGGVTHLPYGTDPEGSRCRINEHVAKATKGRIQDLFSRNDVTAATRLALTNAIVFDSVWAKAFQKHNTTMQPFHVSPDYTVSAPTMSSVGHEVNYLKIDHCEFIELPLRQSQFSFIVLLPNAKIPIAEVEAALSDESFAKAISALKPKASVLSLPKFSVSEGVALKPTLQAMGVSLTFTDAANFSRIADEEIHVSAIVHKAQIAVDEVGTQAAAATGVDVNISIPPRLSIDRPFLTFLIHQPTQTILFMGRVTNPIANNNQ